MIQDSKMCPEPVAVFFLLNINYKIQDRAKHIVHFRRHQFTLNFQELVPLVVTALGRIESKEPEL